MPKPKVFTEVLYTRVTPETKAKVVKRSGGGRNESKYVRDAVIYYNKQEKAWQPKEK